MFRLIFSFVLLPLVVISVASANPTTYDVTVFTSSISGTAGSLDFNFDPGPLVTQAASLQISDFSTDGMLATCARQRTLPESQWANSSTTCWTLCTMRPRARITRTF